ncbi:hypothetical protein KAR91_16500 [Candidatus Pacearchaeota archaeon]|nr:hypothetical protein [Candidatus Pacearchaeota archaeon]
MKESHELSKIFEEELNRVLAKEIAEKDYLPHEDFNNSLDRSEAIIEAATEVCKKILAVSIAKHRKDKHNEDTGHEIEKYSKDLEPEQLEITNYAWWQA